MHDTAVTFAQGETSVQATVVASGTDDHSAFVILDRTAFHPVDHTWPDQPGDLGVLRATDDATLAITDTVMAARDGDGEILLGADIPVKRGAPGWTWFVAHRTATELPVGTNVSAEADAERRSGLSRGHTACHLASLALDAALADLWRKDPGVDPLGNPNFEARANQSSRIHVDGAVDEYRLGKSLRKAGFDTEGLAASLADREQHINATLATWVASGARSWIASEGETITDRRSWHCALPEGEVSFLCGGTHVASLAEFTSITVQLDLSDPQLLVMTTSVS